MLTPRDSITIISPWLIHTHDPASCRKEIYSIPAMARKIEDHSRLYAFPICARHESTRAHTLRLFQQYRDKFQTVLVGKLQQ